MSDAFSDDEAAKVVAGSIEQTAAWRPLQWQQWLWRAAVTYFGPEPIRRDERAFRPFVIVSDDRIALQIRAQIARFAPGVEPRVASAAAALCRRWMLEDGMAPLRFFVSLAGLTCADDLAGVIRVVEGKLSPILGPSITNEFYAAVTDYIIPRLTPAETLDFVELVRARRPRTIPWLLSSAALTKIILENPLVPVAGLISSLFSDQVTAGDDEENEFARRLWLDLEGGLPFRPRMSFSADVSGGVKSLLVEADALWRAKRVEEAPSVEVETAISVEEDWPSFDATVLTQEGVLGVLRETKRARAETIRSEYARRALYLLQPTTAEG